MKDRYQCTQFTVTLGAIEQRPSRKELPFRSIYSPRCMRQPRESITLKSPMETWNSHNNRLQNHNRLQYINRIRHHMRVLARTDKAKLVPDREYHDGSDRPSLKHGFENANRTRGHGLVAAATAEEDKDDGENFEEGVERGLCGRCILVRE